MSKIIWKDIESSDIKGLLICELPPITKPKLKVQETSVDGVDGSTFEELGYESYDKSIKIGLTYNYDIDEVIDYFSGKGKLVFSNEDDKYYNARIINQIDYNSLLRFKEATITFRVQPFKYELDEVPTTITTSGSSVINNGLLSSKPLMIIKGSGEVTINVNDLPVFNYSFREDETEVYIDSEKQDAYLGSILKNRNMYGDFPMLNPSKNTISWTGNVEKIIVYPRSRWL